MGTLKDKLNWLIDRKKDLVNYINSKTTYNNTTGSSKPFSGKYADANWQEMNKQIYAMYPSNFCEVIVYRMYTNSGSVSSGYNTNYVRSGVSISVSRASTGIFNISVTRPSDLNGFELIAWAIGGKRGSNYNDQTYATISHTNYTTTGTSTFRLITGDQADVWEGEFTLMIMAVKI